MELSIIQRVAQLIATHRADGVKGSGKNPAPEAPRDRVEFSEPIPTDVRVVAERIATLPERDPEREARVQRLREAVQARQYRMTEAMVDEVAQKIAKMLA